MSVWERWCSCLKYTRGGRRRGRSCGSRRERPLPASAGVARPTRAAELQARGTGRRSGLVPSPAAAGAAVGGHPSLAGRTHPRSRPAEMGATPASAGRGWDKSRLPGAVAQRKGGRRAGGAPSCAEMPVCQPRACHRGRTVESRHATRRAPAAMWPAAVSCRSTAAHDLATAIPPPPTPARHSQRRGRIKSVRAVHRWPSKNGGHDHAMPRAVSGGAGGGRGVLTPTGCACASSQAGAPRLRPAPPPRLTR